MLTPTHSRDNPEKLFVFIGLLSLDEGSLPMVKHFRSQSGNTVKASSEQSLNLQAGYDWRSLNPGQQRTLGPQKRFQNRATPITDGGLSSMEKPELVMHASTVLRTPLTWGHGRPRHPASKGRSSQNFVFGLFSGSS